jgi:hypothetical protein
MAKEYSYRILFAREYSYGILLLMPPEELDKLMADLRAWCDAQYGRQAEFAAALGVSKQL